MVSSRVMASGGLDELAQLFGGVGEEEEEKEAEPEEEVGVVPAVKFVALQGGDGAVVSPCKEGVVEALRAVEGAEEEVACEGAPCADAGLLLAEVSLPACSAHGGGFFEEDVEVAEGEEDLPGDDGGYVQPPHGVGESGKPCGIEEQDCGEDGEVAAQHEGGEAAPARRDGVFAEGEQGCVIEDGVPDADQ